MTAHGRGGPGPGPGTGGPQALRLALWLAAVLAGCALSFMGVTALAPSISQSLQLSPQSIGLFSGALWASALVASLWGGPVVARFGPWAATRACLVFCALGLLAIAAGNPAMFWLGAVLIGLGHGLEAPPASQLLGHFVAVARRPFIFSLKQMGVQAGAVVASLSLPAAALLVGWQATLTVAAVLLFVLAAMITRPARLMPMPMPKSMPQQPPAGQPPGPGLRPSGGARAFVSALSWSATLGALVHWLPTLQRQPGLLRLSLAACCFGATQVSMNTFLVTWMVTAHGLPLTTAGALAACAQGAGLVGRPLWGWVASRGPGSGGVLTALGALMAACSLLTGVYGRMLPVPWLGALLVLFGLSASGWNGLFLAEVAARSPEGAIAHSTAAALVPLYVGLVAGPVAFAFIGGAVGLSAGFILTAGVALAGTVCVPRQRAR